MKCPKCSFLDTLVRDSRVSERLSSVRRRRACPSCGHKFTTYEIAGGLGISVIKKSGAVKPFMRSKLRKSFALALNKRPISSEQIEMMIDTIVEEVSSYSSGPASTSVIGNAVLRCLMSKDKIAYVRYASVYLNFDSPEDFIEILEGLKLSGQRIQG